MRSIQTIIQRLGYEKSDHLIYQSEYCRCKTISWHDRRVLKQLLPYAVYVVDGVVLVAFFDDLHIRDNYDLQCKIWNAQIPVVISDEGDAVKIYHGKSMRINEESQVQLLEIDARGIEACSEEDDFSYWNVTNSIASGIDEQSLGKKCLNDFLIENLEYITGELREKQHISFANRLVLRILFIRYLIDRGINIGYQGLSSNVKVSQSIFLTIIKDKTELFSLFRYLKQEFNGNLFEIDEQSEMEEIHEEALKLIYDFSTAQVEMKTGQLCLFPFYDFNIIPIELISNIYEILLGKEKRDKDKAFYTPEYLADYMIDRTVGRYLVNHKECCVLDPSCGSGVFLVKALRQILERNASADGYICDKEIINQLIKDNIFGVDCNPEAIDVTIFSLYITLFDYQDPKSLKDFRLPLLKENNILCGDFFDKDVTKPIRDICFRFIVGNPPWGNVKQQKLYKMYCSERNIKLQEGEISIAFLAKVQEIGDENTECSLVIPSKILYKGKKPSCDFRSMLLSNVTMQQVLELSAVRKQIFKEAIAPAAVLSYKCQKADIRHKIEYISLKPNPYLKQFGIIMIEPDDIKYVEQSLLSRHDELWKILVYGGYWDFELLTTMFRQMKSIGEVEKEYNLQHGKGIQDHDGELKDSSHLVGRKLLDSDGCIEHFKLNLEHLSIFEKHRIHRPRKRELFEPPYVFFKKGIDCADYSIRAVYTEECLVYKETINCIKGTEEHKNILLNLTGLLNSSLFAYFNLMLGSSAGIEREQVFLTELEKYPYVYDEALVSLVRQIQDAQRMGDSAEVLRERLNQCVLKMYGMQDNYFVSYALEIQIPLLSGRYHAKKCDRNTLERYAQVFCEAWVKRLERTGISYSINLYPDIKGKFAAFQMKLSFEPLDFHIHIVEDVSAHMKQLTNLALYQLNDCFSQKKNIFEYEDDSFVIIKSIEAKNWHPAMAVKDSYRALNVVLLGEEDCK